MLKAVAVVLIYLYSVGEVSASDANTLVAVEAPGLWQLVGCEPIYDMRQAHEPVIAWDPRVMAIDAIALTWLPPYEAEPDGHEKILVLQSEWVRYDDPRWEEWFGLDKPDTSPCAYGS